MSVFEPSPVDDTSAGRDASGITSSIVICCYSDERWTDVCAAIRSVLDMAPAAEELVVVVDHNPGLLTRLGRRFPGCLVVPNAFARGLSGARNTGIAQSAGNLVVFIDDDASAAPDLLAQLSRHMADPAVLGVGAKVLPNWSDGRPGWFPDEFLWVLGCTYRGMRPGPVRNPIGAAMCVRRTVFDAVGGFDQGLGRTHADLPFGCEETELCIRAARHAPEGRFVYEPRAVCSHTVPARRATWSYFATRCYAEGVSKAFLATLAGSAPALRDERSYVLTTLPSGFLWAAFTGIVRLDAAAVMRAGAIVLGLAATTFGFCRGKLLQASGAAPASGLPINQSSPRAGSLSAEKP